MHIWNELGLWVYCIPVWCYDPKNGLLRIVTDYFFTNEKTKIKYVPTNLSWSSLWEVWKFRVLIHQNLLKKKNVFWNLNQEKIFLEKKTRNEKCYVILVFIRAEDYQAARISGYKCPNSTYTLILEFDRTNFRWSIDYRFYWKKIPIFCSAEHTACRFGRKRWIMLSGIVKLSDLQTTEQTVL